MLSCFRCREEIRFDPKKRSKYGKYIPLDPKTNEIHSCTKLDLESKSFQKNTKITKKPEIKQVKVKSNVTKIKNFAKKLLCYDCGKEIVFDSKRITADGKLIPLDVVTKNFHKCEKRKISKTKGVSNYSYREFKSIGHKLKDLDNRNREEIKRHYNFMEDEENFFIVIE